MISPQNLAIGAAAVGMAGQEGELFRKVLKWSLLLVLIMCVLVYLQSTACWLGWSSSGPARRWSMDGRALRSPSASGSCGAEHVVTHPHAAAHLRVRRAAAVRGHARARSCCRARPRRCAAVVRACHRAGVPWVARGAGSGLSGGALPVEEGVLISLTRMRRIARGRPRQPARRGRAGRDQPRRVARRRARPTSTRPTRRARSSARSAATWPRTPAARTASSTASRPTT